MKNEEQLKHIERIRKYIAREQLVSCMNDTKWTRLVNDLADQKVYGPVTTYKLLRSDEVYGPSHVDWFEFLDAGMFILIEWMKFDFNERVYRGRLVEDRVIDRKNEIVRWLTSINIPFEEREDGIVVYGYKRPTPG